MNIFKFEVKRGIKTLIFWSLGTSLIIIMFMALFPSMKDMGIQEMMKIKIDAMPTKLLEAINFSESVDFSNINDYLAYTLQYISMAAAMYGAVLGVGCLIKEEGDGTIEFLYSKPVTRTKILWNKVCSVALLFLMYLIILTITTFSISFIVKPNYLNTFDLLMNIKTIFLGMALIGYLFMALGLFISSILKRDKGASTLAISLFFLTYILGIISKLKEGFQWVKYLSPYEWFIPANLLKNGFEGKYILISMIIIILFLIGANLIYKKKDMYIN